jgi:hypothetical protein
LKIGERLNASETERCRIEMSIRMMGYISYFETAPPGPFAGIASMDTFQLTELLPPDLRKKDWGAVSQVSHICWWRIVRIYFKIYGSDVHDV